MNDTIEEEDWSERFETTQTVVAAYFVYSGLEIVECLWESGTCTFFFEDTSELHELLTKYVSSKAQVEPQGFNNAFVQVRNRMFQAKDNGQ